MDGLFVAKVISSSKRTTASVVPSRTIGDQACDENELCKIGKLSVVLDIDTWLWWNHWNQAGIEALYRDKYQNIMFPWLFNLQDRTAQKKSLEGRFIVMLETAAIHKDICGTITAILGSGSRYFLTMTMIQQRQVGVILLNKMENLESYLIRTSAR